MKKIVALILVPGLLASVLLLPAATSSATPAASSSQIVTRAKLNKNVKIKLRVSGCSNCRVEAVHYANDPTLGYPVVKYLKKLKLKKGKATFTVRRSLVKNLDFILPAQKSFKNQGFLTQLVFKYSGIKKGKKVSANRAAKAKKGQVCWSVPKKNTVTLKARVKLFKNEGRTTARFWASPTQQGRGYARGLTKGAALFFHDGECAQ